MKFTERVFKFSLLVIFILNFSGFSQEKDYWLKMERKGTGFGYEHIQMIKMENGNFEYRFQSLQKADVVGENPQDHALSGRYIVDAELRPISFEYQINFPVKKATISGQIVGDGFEILIEENGKESSLTRIASLDFYFDAVLPDLIFRQRQQKEMNLKILNPFTQQVETETCHVLRVYADSVIARIQNLTMQEYCIDSQGRIQRLNLIELNIRKYMTDAEDARDITFLKTDDGLSLRVKSENYFPNIFNVEHAKIEVQWKDVPFEEFNFEDNRQKIISSESNDGQFKIELEFSRFEPNPTPLTVPITGNQFKQFLGDSEFIQPGAASIQQQLQQIQGEGKDAYQIVNDILAWISTNIRVDYIAETLTGTEVLEQRRGKCAEFAILFASLARAAGIPTKIVLGEANQGNFWVGHLWNEVWLGQWLAVDPTAGVFVSGPSHIKFVDSPTVAGTQRIRFQLVDNLSIEVLDFTEVAGDDSKIETGVVGTTYTNRDYSCKISAPDTSWQITAEESARPGVTIMPRHTDAVRFYLVMFPVPAGTSQDVVLNSRLNVIKSRVKNFKLLKEEKFEIAGKLAPRVVFEFTHEENDGAMVQIVSENCLLTDGFNGYLFKFSAEKNLFEKFVSYAEKIEHSFQLLK